MYSLVVSNRLAINGSTQAHSLKNTEEKQTQCKEEKQISLLISFSSENSQSLICQGLVLLNGPSQCSHN
jgi:hypothetical protein